MVNQRAGIARIGTSGIVVPGSKNSFPESFRSASRLHYYSSIFDTVEVNSTFKKLPRAITLQKWSLEVSRNFRFTVKLWGDITHSKGLNTDVGNVETFMELVNHLPPPHGCILVQFPGSITFSYFQHVENILTQVRRSDRTNQWKFAVELRDKSWYRDETSEMLHVIGASMVLHDMPKSLHLTPDLNAPFTYFRFHGPTGDYKGDYSHEFLSIQSEKIRSLLDHGKEVYAYFNNTMGNAFENSMTLKSMIQ
jgi:uncharacterized protein YecE (DUF72 family)